MSKNESKFRYATNTRTHTNTKNVQELFQHQKFSGLLVMGLIWIKGNFEGTFYFIYL